MRVVREVASELTPEHKGQPPRRFGTGVLQTEGTASAKTWRLDRALWVFGAAGRLAGLEQVWGGGAGGPGAWQASQTRVGRLGNGQEGYRKCGAFKAPPLWERPQGASSPLLRKPRSGFLRQCPQGHLPQNRLG